MRSRTQVAGLVLLLALCAVLLGCRSTGQGQEFSGQFRYLSLEEAPAQIRTHYDRLKAVPGLAVMEQGSRTYLLLMAGRVEQPGLTVDVLELEKPAKRGDPVRLIARLMPGQATEQHPYAVLVLEGARGLSFQARLATRTEAVHDLKGIPLN